MASIVTPQQETILHSFELMEIGEKGEVVTSFAGAVQSYITVLAKENHKIELRAVKLTKDVFFTPAVDGVGRLLIIRKEPQNGFWRLFAFPKTETVIILPEDHSLLRGRL